MYLKLQYLTLWATQPNSHRNVSYRSVILIKSKSKGWFTVMSVVNSRSDIMNILLPSDIKLGVVVLKSYKHKTTASA